MNVISFIPWWIYAIFGVFIALSIIAQTKKSGNKGNSSYQYTKKDNLLTQNELSFYRELRKAAGNLTVMSKVRVADIIEPKKGTSSWQSAFNRISSKHLDFVLCEPAQMKPVLAIELDDASHDKKKAQDRDSVKDSALKSAGFPLLRVRSATGLQEKIRNTINPAQPAKKK